MNYSKQLVNACIRGKLNVVDNILRKYPDLLLSMDNNAYIFSLACMNGHKDVAQLMYQYYPNIDVS